MCLADNLASLYIALLMTLHKPPDPVIVVSPMSTHRALDGLVQDVDLSHLGALARVMVEMTASLAEGCITGASNGLLTDAQGLAFQRIVDFVHASGLGAQIGLRLSHSGPKGSTQVGWHRADEPLAAGKCLAAQPPAPPDPCVTACTRPRLPTASAKNFLFKPWRSARL